MTTTPSVEDRLRRTFQAVAERPVVMAGVNGDPLSGGRRPPSGRRTGLLVAAVMVVVAAVASVALVYGPRSSTPRSHPPAASGPGRAVAAFVPTSPTATSRQLADDAKVLTRRLKSRGDRGAHAEVRGGSVVVFGGRDWVRRPRRSEHRERCSSVPPCAGRRPSPNRPPE